MSIRVLNPIAGELKQIDRLLAEYLKTPYGEIEPLNFHTVEKTGKKLRPAITILFGRACGLDEERMLKLGACFELLHTSTLIHDDVIDKAGTRRGHATHNAKWDNTLTVLYGDFVFSTAMRLAVELKDIAALEQISRITRELVSGELLQNASAFNFPPVKEKYFEIIRLKTAVLFGGCCGIPLLLCHGREKANIGFEIGENIGLAFQLIDDCLDYIADDKLGKPRLIDLKEGKATLPVLLALEKGNDIVADIVQKVFENREISENSGQKLTRELREGGFLAETIQLAKNRVRQALALLDNFPEDSYTGVFRKICTFITERDF
ncbi:MAG: polyprenyl synthetase family protein [Acidobacteria bacterium]|nr:polyprenyl synthetase family protein [Acidobacteriota bacterium]